MVIQLSYYIQMIDVILSLLELAFKMIGQFIQYFLFKKNVKSQVNLVFTSSQKSWAIKYESNFARSNTLF